MGTEREREGAGGATVNENSQINRKVSAFSYPVCYAGHKAQTGAGLCWNWWPVNSTALGWIVAASSFCL